MLRFVRDFRFDVREDVPQIIPMFGDGRGAHVSRGDVRFILEESTSSEHCAGFDLFLTDYTADEIQSIVALGHTPRVAQGLGDEAHFFSTPDGGQFVL
jgi:hypothetical protein